MNVAWRMMSVWPTRPGVSVSCHDTSIEAPRFRKIAQSGRSVLNEIALEDEGLCHCGSIASRRYAELADEGASQVTLVGEASLYRRLGGRLTSSQ
jgi:hypothetical protein